MLSVVVSFILIYVCMFLVMCLPVAGNTYSASMLQTSNKYVSTGHSF